MSNYYGSGFESMAHECAAGFSDALNEELAVRGSNRRMVNRCGVNAFNRLIHENGLSRAQRMADSIELQRFFDEMDTETLEDLIENPEQLMDIYTSFRAHAMTCSMAPRGQKMETVWLDT
ncbi:hypothetical protein, partial [Deinococcus soli (ex Cha et al. 2016)]